MLKKIFSRWNVIALLLILVCSPALFYVWNWAHRPTGVDHVNYGWLSWLLSAMAGGVFLSGVRDMVSAQRQKEWPELPHN